MINLSGVFIRGCVLTRLFRRLVCLFAGFLQMDWVNHLFNSIVRICRCLTSVRTQDVYRLLVFLEPFFVSNANKIPSPFLIHTRVCVRARKLIDVTKMVKNNFISRKWNKFDSNDLINLSSHVNKVCSTNTRRLHRSVLWLSHRTLVQLVSLSVLFGPTPLCSCALCPHRTGRPIKTCPLKVPQGHRHPAQFAAFK